MKILMVCLGNICRSPLAEGIMKAKAKTHALNWEVDSAGTGYWHVGELPDPRSIAVARQHGIDITDQRARQIKPADLDRFDLVLAMDQSNYRDILRLQQQDEAPKAGIHMILPLAYPSQIQDVPDPYWDDNGFKKVFDMLDDACEQIIRRWKAGGLHPTPADHSLQL
ncbi:MAG: low molecular weight phosphotyrosine protein phosphatase [Saprospiraceae bacterium]|jgi:protein-tyrosine phosphatase|nr:low molecular weight phosphotyrosine protein phosphatase [Saprospiraceae bacterium]